MHAVGFDQPQAMENGRLIFISGLVDVGPVIVREQAGRQITDGNKLHLLIIHVNDHAAAEQFCNQKKSPPEAEKNEELPFIPLIIFPCYEFKLIFF